MKDFNYLTTINGIYNLSEEASEFNRFLSLTVFIRDDYKMRIIAKDYIINEHCLTTAKESQYTLGLTMTEYCLILRYINKDNDFIKNLIFNKFQAYLADEQAFDYVD